MIHDDFDPPDDDDFDGPDAEQETVDAANPARLRDRRRRADIEKENAERFWKAVLADPTGRQELWRIIQSGHAFEERFACGPNGFPQPEATWFQAGEQAFALRLYQTWLALDPEAVIVMHREHDHRFASRDKRKKAGKLNG